MIIKYRNANIGRPRLMKDTKQIATHLPGNVALALWSEANIAKQSLSAYLRKMLQEKRPDLPWEK